MKMFFIGARFLVFLLVFLSASHAFAQSVVVDCTGDTPGAFTSLETAILNSPDNSSFSVSGTCAEGLSIQNRSNLVIFGNPTATLQPPVDHPAVSILASRSITFFNVNFSGGDLGLGINSSQNVSFSNMTQSGASAFGISSIDSIVHVSTSSITGNVRTGIVVNGGTFYLDGAVNVNSNGRLGLSAGSNSHLLLSDGSGPNIISHNGLSGVQIFGTSHGDFSGDNEITNNNTTNAAGQFGLLVQSNSGLIMDGGTISSNAGLGVACDLHSQCQISDAQVNSNLGDGVDIIEHSSATFGNTTVSHNSGTGVLVDQGSSLSTGGDTIASNTGDGLVLNTLSSLNFLTPDTITPSVGNLALNCNNGSMVEGDVSTYKPKKCGTQFQNNPIH